MDKKRFRSSVADRDAAGYPSLLDDEGRRSFLRALGAGLLGAAVGALASACDDGTNTLAGKPDSLWSLRDAAVEQPADGWVPTDSSGTADMPPDDYWNSYCDGLPSDTLQPPDLGSKDVTPKDAPAEQPSSDSGGLDDGGTRPDTGRRP